MKTKPVAEAKPVTKKPVTKKPVVRKDGKPTRAEKSVINKARLAELRAMIPKKQPVVRPEGLVPRGKGNKFCDAEGRWDPELVVPRICELIKGSSASLADLVFPGADGHALPDPQFFRNAVSLSASLFSQYTRAKCEQMDFLGEECLAISNTPCISVKSIEKPSGTEIITCDAVDHRRLQIETRRWLMSKLAPKKYGDSLKLSGDPDAPLMTASVTLPTDPEAAAEAYQKLIGGKKP